MIRLLLAEDQGMMRGALALLLNLEPDIEVVAEAATGAEATEAALGSARTWRCWTSRCPTAAASTRPPPCGTGCPPAGC